MLLPIIRRDAAGKASVARLMRFCMLLTLAISVATAGLPARAAMPAHQNGHGPATITYRGVDPVAQAAMNCPDHPAGPGHSSQKAPAHPASDPGGCCVAGFCAMNLGLPAATGAAEPAALPGQARYRLAVPLQPHGTHPRPITDPPRSIA